MPSLLDIAERRFIRMSESGNCALKIAHRMIGTEVRSRASTSIALMLGTALEPFCVEFLGHQGLTFYFTGDEQLELGADSPWMVGHCDGIVALEGEVNWWLDHNMPRSVLQVLQSGQPMLAEVKTMNGDSFKQFINDGFTGAFLKQYPPQVQSYLASLASNTYDEIWPDHVEKQNDGSDRYVYGSNAFKALLDEKGWDRPQYALLIAFCKPTEQFGFRIVPLDVPAHEANKARLANIIECLDNDVMPEPSYPTGEDPECFFCPYAYCCPAVQARIDEQATGLDGIPLDVKDAAPINELLSEYAELQGQAKSIKDRLGVMRQEIIDKTGMGAMVTREYYLNLAETKGRRGVDLDKVREVMGEVPYKVGKPSLRLQVRALYGPSGEAKDDDE